MVLAYLLNHEAKRDRAWDEGQGVERMESPQCKESPPGDDEIDPAEKRKAARVAVLIRSAKLVTSHGEFLCIVRDVSQEGVKLRLFHPIPADETLHLELATGDRFGVESIWQRDGLAGFSFVDPIDLHRFIAETSPFPKRPVRLRLRRPAWLKIDGRICDAEIRDLSREGISVETDAPLAIGQTLTVEAHNLPPRAVTVRWRRRPAHGLVLQQLFTLEELARTAARMQLPASFLTKSQEPEAQAGLKSIASPFMQ